jgi:hypothetical protein
VWGKPAEGMPANYDSLKGLDIDVDLGRPGFSLSLNYEFDDMITPGESESRRSRLAGKI